MGEWSEYFEDFPEENPANYVNDRFDPALAESLRAQKLAEDNKVAKEQAALDAEIARIIHKHSGSAGPEKSSK